MLIDLSLRVTQDLNKEALSNETMASFGHMGTHFDVMNKEFPLDFTKRQALVFDVSKIKDRDIDLKDIDITLVKANMFVAFYSAFIEEEAYGTKTYFRSHPQLSKDLIEKLIEKKISIIGVDFAGLRRGAEHTPMDQYCADRGVFVLENLCNLGKVLDGEKSRNFIAHTYPINFANMTGLPCRVVGEVE